MGIEHCSVHLNKVSCLQFSSSCAPASTRPPPLVFFSRLKSSPRLLPAYSHATSVTRFALASCAARSYSTQVGARDGDYEQVRLSSIPHFWHTGLLLTTQSSIRIYMCRLCSDAPMPSSRAVSASVTMPWQPTVAPAAPLAHASSPPSYPPSGSWSTHVPPCSASLRRCIVWVYLRATLNRTFIATHSSDSVVETVKMAASGTGIIGTGAGLSVKTTVIKVQWCVSKSTFCQQAANVFLSFSISIDELDKADAPLISEASVHLLGVQYPVSFSNGFTGYTFPLQHPRSPKNHTQVKTERAGPRQGHKLRLRDAERSCAPLLRPHHEPIRLYFRRRPRRDADARSRRRFLACPPHVTRS
jgi:hypothetical protein